MNPRTLGWTLALCSLPALAWAAPTGTVVLRNGARFDDVEYEVRGNKVRVTLKYGERDFRMSEIKELIPNREEDEDDEDEGDEEAPGRDWPTRFRLVPPEGWEAVPVSTPLVRARMNHSKYDATVFVSVRPADGDWTEPAFGKNAKASRETAERISGEIGAFYAKPPRLKKLEVDSYFSSPVYHLGNYSVQDYGADKKSTRVNSEVRFRRHGFEYAVTYSVKKGDAGAMQHEVDAALAAFTFLPSMSQSEDSYSDYQHGFVVRRPGPDWTLESDPFNETLPARLRTTDKRAQVEIRVHRDSQADSVVSKMIANRSKSRFFEKRSVETQEREGQKVVAFEFDDFLKGGRKKQRFRGFAAQTGPHTLVITGYAPLSDDDARKLAGEVDDALESIRVYAPESLRDHMSRQRDALLSVSEGFRLMSKKRAGEAVQRYDEAIAAYDAYALAFYLRGLAKKAKGDFRGYEEDLAKADELDNTQGYAEDLGDVSALEAKDAYKRKDWPRAIDLYVRSYRSSKDEKELRPLTNAANSLWTKHKKAGNHYDGADEIERKLNPLMKVSAVHHFLAKVFREAGNALVKEKDYSKAKRMASKLKRLGRKVKSPKIESSANALTKSIKKARGR